MHRLTVTIDAVTTEKDHKLKLKAECDSEKKTKKHNGRELTNTISGLIPDCMEVVSSVFTKEL